LVYFLGGKAASLKKVGAASANVVCSRNESDLRLPVLKHFAYFVHAKGKIVVVAPSGVVLNADYVMGAKSELRFVHWKIPPFNGREIGGV
jgi:hypothetical protein